MENVRRVEGLAPLGRGGELQPWSLEGWSLRPDDVGGDILFGGVRHTDLHALGKWAQAFAHVPGRESVGRVTDLGGEVSLGIPDAFGDLRRGIDGSAQPREDAEARA